MWFSARHVIDAGTEDGGTAHNYEERVTIWDAPDFDAAYALARAEAEEYINYLHDAIVLGLFQIFRLSEDPVVYREDEPPWSDQAKPFSAAQGAEVFSLIRESQLGPREYLDQFFDTGDELQSARSSTERIYDA